MATHRLNFKNSTSIATDAPAPWINQSPPATWDQLGEKFGNIDGTGMSLWVTVAFGGSTAFSSLLDQSYFDVPEVAWEEWAFTNAGSPSTIEIRDVPVTPGTLIVVRPFAAVGNNRDLDIITNEGTVRLDHPSSLPPPAEPIDVPVTVDENGTATLQFSAVTVNAAIAGVFIEYPDAPSTPTITNINTNNEFTPGEANTLNGTNLSETGGSIVIGTEAQTITNRTTSAIEFTGVRGGNPYNTDLTLTYTDADSNEVTQTVQQVPAVGFAVTAARPNTTDDASLWTGLVDTSTGNPVTVVDGDQALVTDPNNLGNLAVTPAGEISADTEGNFTVQFWRASEGVWGSDQTVTFEVADSPEPPAPTPTTTRRKRSRRIVRNYFKATVWADRFRGEDD